MNEAINQSPDYLKGLADGYKEGFNAALEQLYFLSQQQAQPMRIEISPEKLEELQKAINEIPMPIEMVDFDKEYRIAKRQAEFEMIKARTERKNPKYMKEFLEKYGGNK